MLGVMFGLPQSDEFLDWWRHCGQHLPPHLRRNLAASVPAVSATSCIGSSCSSMAGTVGGISSSHPKKYRTKHSKKLWATSIKQFLTYFKAAVVLFGNIGHSLDPKSRIFVELNDLSCPIVDCKGSIFSQERTNDLTERTYHWLWDGRHSVVMLEIVKKKNPPQKRLERIHRAKSYV